MVAIIINAIIIVANFSAIYFGYWAINKFVSRLNRRLDWLEAEINEERNAIRVVYINQLNDIKSVLIKQERFEEVGKIDRIIKNEIERMCKEKK